MAKLLEPVQTKVFNAINAVAAENKQGIKGCFNEQALAAVKPLMTDLNILGEYESAI